LRFERLLFAKRAIYPPLWGEQSFIIGAGMGRLYTAAAFVENNMPIGAHNRFRLAQDGSSAPSIWPRGSHAAARRFCAEHNRRPLLDGLNNFKSFELGMPEIKRSIRAARVLMGRAKRVRARPRFERGAIRPDRVTRVEDVIVALGALEQMKFDEAGHVFQVRVAVDPDILEIGLRAGRDLEAIHGDVHARVLPSLAIRFA
jgi:hypothetical protein